MAVPVWHKCRWCGKVKFCILWDAVYICDECKDAILSQVGLTIVPGGGMVQEGCKKEVSND